MLFFSRKKKYESFRIAAMAVIFDSEQKILLAHRTDRDFWNLPGGKVEKGETPWEAVKREVQEEIGVVVDPVNLIGVYSYEKKDYDMIIFTFGCKIISGDPTHTPESDNIVYFTKESLPANLSTRQRERILDAFENSKYTVYRKQTGN